MGCDEGASIGGTMTEEGFTTEEMLESLKIFRKKSLSLSMAGLTKPIQEETDMSTQEDLERMVGELRKLGGKNELIEALVSASFPEDSGVKRHDGLDILLPDSMELEDAIENIRRAREDLETATRNLYTFRYAYDDMLIALDKAIHQIFGFGIQKSSFSFFGMRPPATREVVVGLDSNGQPVKRQVAEGKIALPGLYNEDNGVGYVETQRRGSVCGFISYARKRHQPIIGQLAALTKQYLEKESIFRGQILDANMQFVNPARFNYENLVLTEQLRSQFEDFVMLHILQPDLSAGVGAEPRRNALFFGPFGTGKSMAMGEAAVRAAEAGVTVFTNQEHQRLSDQLEMAKLYQPSLLLIEDVDTALGGPRGEEMNDSLNALDGAIGKNDQVFVIMTTNSPDRIHEAALRPGRISVAVEFGALDGQGLQRLIGQCGYEFEDNIPWDAIAEEYSDLMPAYVKEASNRIGLKKRGVNGSKISEKEVRVALGSMRSHLKLQENATKTHEDVNLDSVLRDLTKEEIRDALRERF